MHVEFERTLDDLIELNLFHMANSPSLQQQFRLRQVLIAFLIFSMLLSILFLINNELTLISIILALLGGGVMFIIYPYTYRALYKRRLRAMLSEGDNKPILGRQVVSISPEGLFSKTQAGESKINWPAVNKVVQSDTAVYLYISAANAIAIPKKAFPTGQELQEFLDEVDTYRTQSGENDQPTVV